MAPANHVLVLLLSLFVTDFGIGQGWEDSGSGYCLNCTICPYPCHQNTPPAPAPPSAVYPTYGAPPPPSGPPDHRHPPPPLNCPPIPAGCCNYPPPTPYPYGMPPPYPYETVPEVGLATSPYSSICGGVMPLVVLYATVLF